MSKRKNGTSQVALSVDHLRREYRTGNIVVIENHRRQLTIHHCINELILLTVDDIFSGVDSIPSSVNISSPFSA